MTDKEKQIEEMAFNLIMATSPLGVKDLTKVFDYKTVATDLYNLYGWRKEKQGEWITDKYTEAIYCSVCNEIAPVDCMKERFYKSDYCPSCGARMKGE